MTDNVHGRILELLNKMIDIISIYETIQDEFKKENEAILTKIDPQLTKIPLFEALFITLQMGAAFQGYDYNKIRYNPYRISKESIAEIKIILTSCINIPEKNMLNKLQKIFQMLISDINIANSTKYVLAIEKSFKYKNYTDLDKQIWSSLENLFNNYLQSKDLCMNLKSLVENLISLTENGHEALYKICFPLDGNITIITINSQITSRRKDKINFKEYMIKPKTAQYCFLEKLLIYENDFVPYSNLIKENDSHVEFEKIRTSALHTKSNLLRSINYALQIYFIDNKIYLNNCYKSLFNKENLDTLYRIEAFKILFPDSVFKKTSEEKCFVIRNMQYDDIKA